MNWKVPLFKLNYDDSENHIVRNVIESQWLTMGSLTEKFQKEFASYLGSNVECVCVSSGTAALHISLLALGIKDNDEVIIPATTFVADANVVKMVGANPVLADSTSVDDLNVSVNSIQERITSKTKAVIVVHFAGYPCDIRSIKKLCDEHGIYLIEDVAHAPGASISGKLCGTWGDIGCFSFFSNKNLSVGEGGMISAKDKNILDKLIYLRSHGMTSLTFDRHKGRAISYDVEQIGLNYRIDEIRAALGLVQLDKLPSGNAKREYLTNLYHSKLSNTELSIPFLYRPKEEKSSYHIYPVLLPEVADRRKIIDSLKEKGIQSSIHYPSFADFSAYKDSISSNDTPISSEISKRELTLPLFPTMTDEEVDLVADSLVTLIAL